LRFYEKQKKQRSSALVMNINLTLNILSSHFRAALMLHPLMLVVLGVLGGSLQAQVPGIISYQGRVAVSNAAFNGNGQFKFALVERSREQQLLEQ